MQSLVDIEQAVQMHTETREQRMLEAYRVLMNMPPKDRELVLAAVRAGNSDRLQKDRDRYRNDLRKTMIAVARAKAEAAAAKAARDELTREASERWCGWEG